MNEEHPGCEVRESPAFRRGQEVKLTLPAATGWADAADEDDGDTVTPYWETFGYGTLTAWTGAVDVDGDYREDLDEMETEALAMLAAVTAAKRYRAEREAAS